MFNLRVVSTVYPKKYAHGFVVLCFVVVMQSFIMNSHEVFIHIHQGCFADTRTIVRLPQCQWGKPDRYGKSSQCITTTKHSKAKTVCIFLGIYCTIVHQDNSGFYKGWLISPEHTAHAKTSLNEHFDALHTQRCQRCSEYRDIGTSAAIFVLKISSEQRVAAFIALCYFVYFISNTYNFWVVSSRGYETRLL